MQKKQLIQFAALLILILAAAGAYIGIRSFQARQEEEKSRQESEAVIPLTSFEPESVTAISYDVDKAVYAFQKEGETWKASDSDIILDQDAFTDFLKQAGSVTSETEVEIQEGEDYGFSEPVRTVTITTKNGTSSLIFGMKNEMLEQYYVKTSESSKIYLVEESVYTIFDQTTEDFEQEETQSDADANAETEVNADTDSEANAD